MVASQLVDRVAADLDRAQRHAQRHELDLRDYHVRRAQVNATLAVAEELYQQRIAGQQNVDALRSALGSA